MCREGGGRKRERGGASVAMAVTSGVRERTGPFPRALARVHTQRHAHARAPLSLRHTGGKGQTKGEGAGRPEGSAAAAVAARHDGRGGGCFLSADAAELLLSQLPLPPPQYPSPRRSRVPASPPPEALPARATDGRGRWRVGAAAGGPFHRATPDSFAQPLGESPPGECSGEGGDVKRG